VRASIANSFHLSEEDGFGLLDALGADCAGAVTVLPPGSEPAFPTGRRKLLDVGSLGRLIEELPRNPLGVSSDSDGVRLSLGGLQHKLVLTGENELVGSMGGKILTGLSQPLEGAPSTCLVKPEFGQYGGLVLNEYFCMRVAGSLGLEVADIDFLVSAVPVPSLFVERYDRTTINGLVRRLHQEDMCQALGVLPAAKYEVNGGPSVAAIVGLLRRLGGSRMARDINDFIHAVLINFLLGNSDAHGKNFALLYEESGVRLAPLYDVVSGAVYPDITDRMAMKIGGIDDPEEVDMAAWGRLAEECELGGGIAPLIRRRAKAALKAAEIWRTDPWVGAQKSLALHRDVLDAIVDVCRRRTMQLVES
jgi:serine/threonine-protein kinase HipA